MGNPRHVHVGQLPNPFPHHPWTRHTAFHFPHNSFYIPFLPLVQNKNNTEKSFREREKEVGILDERKSRGKMTRKREKVAGGEIGKMGQNF